MLDFKINLKRPEYLSLKWDGSSFSYGDSYIRPFQHTAIGGFALGDSKSQQFLFVVYERNFRTKDPVEELQVLLLANTQQLDAVKAAMLAWPLNAVLLEISQEKVSVHNSSVATCPLYITSSDHVIHGSWDYFNVCKKSNDQSINQAAIRSFISTGQQYSSQTFLSKVHLLTERTRFDFDGSTIKIHAPDKTDYIQPKVTRENADVVSSFDELISASVSQWLDPAQKSIGIEASGGLDSSCVALTIRKNWTKELNAFSILLENNDAGKQQRHRRDELIRKIGAIDHTIEGYEFLPLSCDIPYAPNEEVYIEALTEEINIASQIGCSIIFTGIGGDELTKLSYSEHLDVVGQPENKPPTFDYSILVDTHSSDEQDSLFLEPSSVLPISTLLAANARAPSFLRKGVWPAHPLAVPDVCCASIHLGRLPLCSLLALKSASLLEKNACSSLLTSMCFMPNVCPMIFSACWALPNGCKQVGIGQRK